MIALRAIVLFVIYIVMLICLCFVLYLNNALSFELYTYEYYPNFYDCFLFNFLFQDTKFLFGLGLGLGLGVRDY